MEGTSVSCILWTGARVGGYGQRRVNGVRHYVHRLVWEQVNGPIPVGMLVLHKCDTPACINPEHLFIGTHKDNMQDCLNKHRHVNKLTDEQVKHIRSSTLSHRILAKLYGVSHTIVGDVRRNQTYKGVTP
jgi:hypothetical protein